MWTITDPSQLPIPMRKTHGDPYLANSFFPMWLEGLQVAHQLLDQHQQRYGNDTYHQDKFGADYIAALANPCFGSDEIVFDSETDPSLAHSYRHDQPAWQTFRQATEALKTAPRGAIALLRDGERWHIRIHAGDGCISECRTMRSSGPKPSAKEIRECLLAYEAYTARHHANLEKEYLMNFSRLRELRLKPGMTVQDVRVLYKGKFRPIRFLIKSITETGYLSLVDGVLRGCRGRFNATVAAYTIEASQVQSSPSNKAVPAADLDTAPLF